MRRSFSSLARVIETRQRGPAFWFPLATGVLLLLNLIAAFFYVFPPGGSRSDLLAQSQSIQAQIGASRRTKVHLQNIAGKVQIGSKQASEFASRYFLKRRDAYEQIIGELQRMAAASGLQERDGVNTEEPIEGSTDLTLLNMSANYEGTYEQLMNFLHQADQSPMLLMLDAVQASPQQRNGQISASIRFQSVIRDDTSGSVGGQP